MYINYTKLYVYTIDNVLTNDLFTKYIIQQIIKYNYKQSFQYFDQNNS